MFSYSFKFRIFIRHFYYLRVITIIITLVTIEEVEISTVLNFQIENMLLIKIADFDVHTQYDSRKSRIYIYCSEMQMENVPESIRYSLPFSPFLSLSLSFCRVENFCCLSTLGQVRHYRALKSVSDKDEIFN